MPRMGGRDAAARVTAENPGVKVIYMSGYNDAAIGGHGVLEPGTHMLQKPFRVRDLVSKVREVLDAR